MYIYIRKYIYVFIYMCIYIYIYICMYYVIRLAEGIDICRSKRKIYEDIRLQAYVIHKIPPSTKNLAYVQMRMG